MKLNATILFYFAAASIAWAGITVPAASAAPSWITPIDESSLNCAEGRLVYALNIRSSRIWQTTPGQTTGLELKVTRFESGEQNGLAWSEADAILPMLEGAYGLAHFKTYQTDSGTRLDFKIKFVDPAHPGRNQSLVRERVNCTKVN